MRTPFSDELRELVDFDRIQSVETIQSLWSGYGSLLRVLLQGSEYSSVIVKHIAPPSNAEHPRGWNSNTGHQRKLRSYEVEASWYRLYGHRTNAHCRIPRLLGLKSLEAGSLLVLEDLDTAGFPLRKSDLTQDELKACLTWLAAFHAAFMLEQPADLWPIGTYWHLDTRWEEYETMAAGPLKTQAKNIHQKLNACKYQTIVHGDAKYANFCFGEDGAVAAVDFQYAGGGCGMKDVAYLLSCIPGGIRHEEVEAALLTHYFDALQLHLHRAHSTLDFTELENEWRRLYPFACADFERFLLGWAPGHWKSSEYSARQVKKALTALENEPFV